MSKNANDANGADAPSAKQDERNASAALEVFKTLVELIRGIIWPLLIAIFFLTFLTPIKELMNELPVKFSAATKVKVGSLSFEIQQQARAAGNPELARRLGNLSPEAVKRLIEIGSSLHILVGDGSMEDGVQTYFVPDNDRLKVVRELDENGLIEFGEELDRFLGWIRSDPFEPVLDLWDPQHFKPTRVLSSREQARLKEQHYQLNDLGLQAWDTILDAVLEQLRAPVSVSSDTTETSPQ